MRNSLHKAALAVSVLGAAAVSHAALIVTAPSVAATVSFADAATYDTSQAKVQIGASIGRDLTVSSLGGSLYVGAPVGAWSLGSNGEWTGAEWVGVDGDDQSNAGLPASLVFDLAMPTSAIGAFLNFDPDFSFAGLPLPLYIAAYGAGGALLEDYFVPVWTPGGINEGAFFGIDVGQAAITRFEISGPYAVADNVVVAIPEPQSYALILLGLGAIGLFSRGRQQRG